MNPSRSLSLDLAHLLTRLLLLFLRATAPRRRQAEALEPSAARRRLRAVPGRSADPVTELAVPGRVDPAPPRHASLTRDAARRPPVPRRRRRRSPEP